MEENCLERLRWRWLRSSARHRLVWKSGLVVAAERSGSSLLKAWTKRERDIYVYATLRCLQELRDA